MQCFLCTNEVRRKDDLFSQYQYSIKIDQSALNEYEGKLVGQGTTDDKGKFIVSIDLKTEQPISLFIGNLFFSLWIKPNTTLSIQENSKADYIFSGASAMDNNILFKSGLMQPFKVPTNIGSDYFNPNKQIAYLDSIENDRLQILKSMDNDNTLSKIFLSYYNTKSIFPKIKPAYKPGSPKNIGVKNEFPLDKYVIY
ncbi:MAG: hypothetical protein ABIN89_20435 [Chitinophagaceae bacterium]